MSTTLDHLLVPAHDKDASARFLAELLEVELRDHSVGSPPGYFAVVQVGSTGLDFADLETFESQHYAFAVDDGLFDRVLARLDEAGLAFSADPTHGRVGELNDYNGGRGLYFNDPNGHNIELLTRPLDPESPTASIEEAGAARRPAGVEKFSSDALPTWMTDNRERVLFGDVVDESSGAKVDVTFIRWSAGERHRFNDPLPYDEVFIVTKGSYSVRTADHEVTAEVGEVIYLWAGVTGEYLACEDAEIVAVTFPPYRKALTDTHYQSDLEQLHQVTASPSQA